MPDSTTTQPLACQRERFDLPRDIAYINCAYFSPFLRAARDAGHLGIERRVHPWTIDREGFYAEVEEVRGLFARLLGASTADVSIVPSSSYGLAIAAANVTIARGQTVVVPQHEHSSNFYVWHKRATEAGGSVVVVERPADGDWTAAVLAAIDSRTAVVAMPNCHWSDASLIDLVPIGEAARRVGAALIVDATQSVGAWPFDLARVKPDYVMCSGYKWLFCPYVLGFLYVAPHRQNGHGIEFHGFNREGARHTEGSFAHVFEFEPGARRFDMGERSNFITLPMAKVGLQQLLDWSVAGIAATLAPMTRQIAERGAELGLTSPRVDRRLGNFIGLGNPKGWAKDIGKKLWSERVHVSLRGDRLRISPHVYNDQQDLDRLFAALKRHA
ncbi:MAG: aminotransferase class V-fold PLP-dependent enzyme [Alphaproteobacteria bacterium]|nr:aminotransferase class V-fold PLP-dependent enzyme [Alphaproteobacteria bacterium]